MRKIQLSNGLFTLVDAEDFERLSKYNWSFSMGYAVRSTYETGKKTLRMHREIMNAAPGTEVDHADGDKLDNRKQNLRLAKHLQNSYNKRLYFSNTSGFRGVHALPNGKFKAYINAARKRINLGSHSTAEEAARAYDEAAVVAHGEFARLNFP